jgi:hypothetical protein
MRPRFRMGKPNSGTGPPPQGDPTGAGSPETPAFRGSFVGGYVLPSAALCDTFVGTMGSPRKGSEVRDQLVAVRYPARVVRVIDAIALQRGCSRSDVLVELALKRFGSSVPAGGWGRAEEG